jgi:hypothetical protein
VLERFFLLFLVTVCDDTPWPFLSTFLWSRNSHMFSLGLLRCMTIINNKTGTLGSVVVRTLCQLTNQLTLWHSVDSQHFMEPEGSLPRSQELSACTSSEPDQSSPQHSILSRAETGEKTGRTMTCLDLTKRRELKNGVFWDVTPCGSIHLRICDR